MRYTVGDIVVYYSYLTPRYLVVEKINSDGTFSGKDLFDETPHWGRNEQVALVIKETKKEDNI